MWRTAAFRLVGTSSHRLLGGVAISCSSLRLAYRRGGGVFSLALGVAAVMLSRRGSRVSLT